MSEEHVFRKAVTRSRTKGSVFEGKIEAKESKKTGKNGIVGRKVGDQRQNAM